MQKMKYTIGFALIGAAFFYLIWTSFKASFQFSLTPSELFEKHSEYEGKLVKISGIVKNGSINFVGGSYFFIITDGGADISIHYKGMMPNTFRDGAEVVASGRFTTAGETFEATQILTKCASKYETKKE